MTRLAFHATIKPPDHPIASGDRLIARNLMAALKLAGYEVELASRFIAYSKRPAADILAARKAEALAEAERLIARCADSPPDAWVAYHPYCKAPDWLGPRVAQAFDIPLITVEAARTGQGFENGGDLWANWRAEAQAGLRAADLHLAFKSDDADYLRGLDGVTGRIEMIAPFIDVPQQIEAERQVPPVLLAVGQMRPGKKLRNYEMLAQLLARVAEQDWHCRIIGDGPERAAAEALFAPFQDRVSFAGAVPHEEVLAEMARASLLVWPGWREPIGMVYLEAQAMGLPVIAFDEMGPPLVVADGCTGRLVPAGDVAAYGDAIGALLADEDARGKLAHACRPHIIERHSLDAGAASLRAALCAAGLAP